MKHLSPLVYLGILVTIVVFLLYRNTSFATPKGGAYATMWNNTDCWTASADLGYQGVQNLDTIKKSCDKNPACRGFTKHSAGELLAA
jgi:high-affinity Fe2+/Pb2+ permease